MASEAGTVEHRETGAGVRGLAAPAAVAVAACLLAVAAGWNNSATNDEPYHTLAGFSYVADGHGDLNPEHPPLTKLLAGLTLAPLGLRDTAAPPVRRLYVLSQEVRRFLYFNTSAPMTILRLARLPELTFLLLLLLGVHRWSRELWGDRAALIALVAVACQPLVLGHAFLVHTDVASAAGWVWTLYLLHRWLRRGRGWWLFGLALGGALLVKFTSVYLAPLAAATVLGDVLRTRRWRALAELAAAGAVALLVLIAGYLPVLRNVGVAEERATIDAYMKLWRHTEGTARNLDGLAGISTPLAHYGLGVAYVVYSDRAGRVNYFLGQTSLRGFGWYFPVALAIKTTAPFLALGLFGVALAVWRHEAEDLWLLLYASLYLVLSIGSTYNIGARHLMPVLPLLAMLGAHHAARWRTVPRAALLAALAAGAAASFPHYIAHFSLLIGGSAHGDAYLSDSNLDWGQDWVRLADEAKREGWRPLSYVYLGAGFPASDLPGSRDFLAGDDAVTPGIYAVSSFVAATGPAYLAATGDAQGATRLAGLLATLRERGREIADVGHTITVYRLGPESAAHGAE
jgi:hypothetical protein